MSVTWPSQLPVPVVDGYTLAPQDATVRTEMEVGPARQRRRSTAMPTQVTMKCIMTRTQFQIFEAWFKYKALDGAAWFVMPVANGSGVTDTDARFTAPYQAAALPGLTFEVSATVECRTMAMLSEAELEAIINA